MLSNIGVPGLILILIIALVVFGPKKLPEIGRSFGRTLKEFKHATNDIVSNEDEVVPSTHEEKTEPSPKGEAAVTEENVRK